MLVSAESDDPLRSAQGTSAEAALLTRVHHELKTPLFAILTAAEILRQVADPQWSWILEILDSNTARLRALVEDLLLFADLSRGELSVRSEPLDLEALFAEQTKARREEVELKRLEFQSYSESPVPLALGDERLTRAAVSQLLDNAIKFNHEGGRVEASWSDLGAQVELRIANTGDAIPDSHRELIFGSFFQIEDLITRTKGGLGLGLAIVRKALEAQNGSVSVGRLADGRNLFTLRLPKA